MKANVQVLSGLIRVGPTMESFGDDYEIMAAFSSTDAKTAIIMGASMDKEGAKLTREHVRAALLELKRVTGLDGDWYRARDLKT